MGLYTAVHMVSCSTYTLRMYLDNQCCESKPFLSYMECCSYFFQSSKHLSKIAETILYFVKICHFFPEIYLFKSETNQKTVTKLLCDLYVTKLKKHLLCKFTEFFIKSTKIHKNPSFPLEESSMPQSKKGQQKGRHFRKDDCSLPVYLLY